MRTRLNSLVSFPSDLSRWAVNVDETIQPLMSRIGIYAQTQSINKSFTLV